MSDPPRRRPPRAPSAQQLREAVDAARLRTALAVGPPKPVVQAPPQPALDEVPNASRIGPPPVKHINQSRPDGATGEYLDIGFCAPTCMAMVARAFGLGATLSDAELVTRLSRIAGADQGGGTDRVGLYRMAAHLKLKSLDFDGEATFWMAKQLELGRYIIAAGNPFVLPPRVRMERFGAHVIVVDGMDDDGNFLMKNPWPDGVHTVPPPQMQKFLLTHTAPYQYAFWR